MIAPKVTFNGHPIAAPYGTTQLPVPAGPLHVEVHSQWLRRFGQAALDVDVAPGQTVPIFYATPWHQFSTGSIGHTKQHKKGVGLFAGLIVLAVTIGLLVALL